MRRTMLAALLAVGCDAGNGNDEDSIGTMPMTTTVAATTSEDEGSSSEGEPGPLDPYHECIARDDCEDVAHLGAESQCSLHACSYTCSTSDSCPVADGYVVACDTQVGLCRSQAHTELPYARCENNPDCECREPGDPNSQCVTRCEQDVDCPLNAGRCVGGMCLVLCREEGTIEIDYSAVCSEAVPGEWLSESGATFQFRCPLEGDLPRYCEW
jgi:hypothetical protein